MSQEKYILKGNKVRWRYRIIIRENGKCSEISKSGFMRKNDAKFAEHERRKELRKEKEELALRKDMITVDKLFEELMGDRRAKGTKEQSLESYYRCYNKWFRKQIGSLDIRRIDKRTLQKAFDELTPSFIDVSNPLKIMKAVFEYGVNEGVLSGNIVKNIVIKKDLLKEQKIKRDKCIESNEVNNFYSDLSKFLSEDKKDVMGKKNVVYERDMLMYYLLLITGLRVGEVLSLRWSDIDMVNRTIDISKTQIKLYGKYLEGDSPKTESAIRLIPFVNDKLYNMLNIWKDKQKILEEKFPSSDNDLEDLVFYDIAKGKRLPTATYTILLDAFYEVYPQKQNITSHKLRHTFTTLVRGVDIHEAKVEAYIGHSGDKTITDTYTHFNLMEYLIYTAEIADKKIGELIEGAF